MSSTVKDTSNIVTLENYTEQDKALLSSKEYVRSFGDPEDHVEMHIYSPNGSLLTSDYDFKGYAIPGTLNGTENTKTSYLTFSPDTDLINKGFQVGEFNVQYNIVRSKIFNSTIPVFFINEISNDRTEIRLISNILSNEQVESGSLSFISEFQSSPYYKDFLLNFTENNFLQGTNIALDKNTNPFSVLIKLYQPLPSGYDINSPLWIVEELSDSYTFNVILEPDHAEEVIPHLKSPNFDLNLDHHNISPSQYYNYTQIIQNNSLTTYQQLVNLMKNSSIQINIDYNNYDEFVHFSSATQRLNNFVYKLQQIESFNQQMGLLNALTPTTQISSSVSRIQNNINDIIQNFDGYDSFLYYESSSQSWPKSGSSKPYYIYPSTSSVGQAWLGSDDSFDSSYGGQALSASIFDKRNPNNLVYTVPEFVGIDEQNENYLLFIEMIGHHFDQIWTYIKATEDIYHANNSLTKGISKDLVYDVLRSSGIKLYNNKSSDNLFQYLLGISPSGSYSFNTSSFQVPVTASSQTISGQDQVKEIFKRIYHNLPILLKSKGTEQGLRYLINLYGIPDTILRLNEYGGMDKNSSTVQYAYDRYSYSWDFLRYNNSYFSIPWKSSYQAELNGSSGSFDSAIEFRVKPIATSSIFMTQSLVTMNSPSFSFGAHVVYNNINGVRYGNVRLAIASGSGKLMSGPAVVPFYATSSNDDTHWWDILIEKVSGIVEGDTYLIDYDNVYVVDYDFANIETLYDLSPGTHFIIYLLYIKNKINGQIGFQASASIAVTGSLTSSINAVWSTNGNLNFGTDPSGIMSPSGTFFRGKMQEVRTWSYPIGEPGFNYHVLNPQSIEADFSGSFFNYLDQYYPLGNNLQVNNYITHTGSLNLLRSVQPNSASGVSNVSMSVFGFNPLTQAFPFTASTEEYYADVPVAGYLTPVTDKIRIYSSSFSSSVLSVYAKTEPINNQYTADSALVNAAFSPQNELDEDIIDSMGSTFTMDDYIGNPADYERSTYPDLVQLQNFFNRKYRTKFNYKDYISLIKYFDNSLFKMLKDFVAARVNLQTGIAIRPTILNRSKIRMFKPAGEMYVATGSIRTVRLTSDQRFKSGYRDNSDYFTGKFSGSHVNEHDQFNDFNYNPYLESNRLSTDLFYPSDFNVTYGNVEQNVTASGRYKLDLNGTLLIPVEIPNSNYTNNSQILGRYDGSKTTSLLYNVFTSASSGYTGDSSYGKTAAIDKNVLKFAWIKKIGATNLNFYDKTSVIIKYLVDGSGSLTELSAHNYNLFDVQNTFKSHTPVIVSISDLLSPTNQVSLDGNKIIFEGGFSYWPLVYRESAENMSYKYIDALISNDFINITLTQTSSYQYATKVAPASVNKALDADVSLDGYTLTLGNENLTSGQFSLDHVTPFSSWSYASIPALADGTQMTFQSGNIGGLPLTETDLTTDTDRYVYQMNPLFLNFNSVQSNDAFSEYVQLDDGSYAFLTARSSSYNVNINIPFNISINEGTSAGETVVKAVGVLERNTSSFGGGAWQYIANTTMSYVELGTVGGAYAYNASRSALWLDNDTWRSGNDSPIKCMCSITGSFNFDSNTYLRVNFYIIVLRKFLPFSGVDYAKISFKNRFANPPLNVQAGILSFTDKLNMTINPITGSTYVFNNFFTVSGSISGSGSNVLQFSDSASILYGKVRFDETDGPVSANYSSIIYPFTFQQGDILRLGSFYSFNSPYYTVTGVTPPVTGSDGLQVTRSLYVTLDRPVSQSNGISSKFVLFRRTPDETSVILNFNKQPGETSPAILVPWNLDTDVKAQLANVVSGLNQSLNTN